MLILRFMKIFLGADHRGYELKEKIEAYLAKQGYDLEDIGGDGTDNQDDFTDYAQMAVMKVLGEDDRTDPRAILICGSGQGMAMAANRFKGIRAAVLWDNYEAKTVRNDDDSNILCLPSRILDDDAELWKDVVDTWLTTPFAGAARFKRRIAEMDAF